MPPLRPAPVSGMHRDGQPSWWSPGVPRGCPADAAAVLLSCVSTPGHSCRRLLNIPDLTGPAHAGHQGAVLFGRVLSGSAPTSRSGSCPLLQLPEAQLTSVRDLLLYSWPQASQLHLPAVGKRLGARAVGGGRFGAQIRTLWADGPRSAPYLSYAHGFTESAGRRGLVRSAGSGGRPDLEPGPGSRRQAVIRGRPGAKGRSGQRGLLGGVAGWRRFVVFACLRCQELGLLNAAFSPLTRHCRCLCPFGSYYL